MNQAIIFFLFLPATFCLKTVITRDTEGGSFVDLEFYGEHEFFPFEEFDIGIEYKVDQMNDYALTLTKLNMDLNVMTEFLNKFGTSITQIQMIDVTWSGTFITRTYLPNLKILDILRRQWSFQTGTQADFESFFFLTSNPEALEINFMMEFAGDGDGRFRYIPDQMLMKENDRFDIPEEMFPNITKIFLSKSVLDVRKLDKKDLQMLKGMSARDLTIVGGTLNDLIDKMPNLNMFEVFEKTTTDSMLCPEWTSECLPYIDISKFPVKEPLNLHLENLAVSTSLDIPLPIRYLGIRNCILNFTNTNFIKSMHRKQILFDNSQPYEHIHDLVCTLNNVMNLTLIQNYPEYPLFDISCLKTKRSKYTSLELGGLKISLPESVKFTMKNVKSLKINNCIMNENLLSLLDEVFPNIEKFTLMQKIPKFEHIEKILNTNVQLLFLWNLFSVTDDQMLKFLKEAGVPSDQDNAGLVKQKGNWTYYNYGMPIPQNHENAVFYTYVLTLLCVCTFGILGNGISIAVLSGKSFHNSISVMLIGLAMFDSTILLCFALSLRFHGFILVTMFLDLYSLADPSDFQWSSNIALLGRYNFETVKYLGYLQASVIYPLQMTAYTGSVYSTLVLTGQRYAAVCWPLQLKAWITVKRSVMILTSVLVFSILLNSPRWIEGSGAVFILQTYGHGNYKLLRIYDKLNMLEYETYRKYYHGVAWSVLMYVMPMLLISALNTKILIEFKRSKHERQEMSAKEWSDEDEKQVSSLTQILLAVSTVFIICNAINGILLWILVSHGKFDPQDAETIVAIPTVFNSSVNFILYCLFGGTFRQEMVKKFQNCLSWRKRRNRLDKILSISFSMTSHRN